MTVFLILVVVAYTIFTFLLCVLWKLYPINDCEKRDIEGVSIVVPLRNEKDNIYQLINSVNKMSKAIPFELILVNDHSQDLTKEELEVAFKGLKSDFTLMHLPDGLKGKKQAVAKGVEAAKYPWIWQIDADVVFHPKALETFSEFFNDSTTLILGPVNLINKRNNWLNHFQMIENSLLQWVTGLTALFRSPVLANGANMFYNKAAFLNYHQKALGYELESGDDLFLLNYIKNNYGSKSIRYCKHPNCMVHTLTKENWADLYQQKSRWLSKMNHNDLKVSYFLRGILSIVLSIPFVLLFAVLLNFIGFKLFIGLLLIKIVFEIFGFSILQGFFRKGLLSVYLPVFLLIYPYYILKVLGNTKKEIIWKDRVLK